MAVVGQNKFFRDKLADDLTAKLNTAVAPVLQLRVLIVNSDDTRRANTVEALGADERFFMLNPSINCGAKYLAPHFRQDFGLYIAAIAAAAAVMLLILMQRCLRGKRDSVRLLMMDLFSFQADTTLDV
jgi:hypothetical protein